MKEITLTKQNMLKIINEEVARFSEKIEHDAIVDNFARKFATVFTEALGVSTENKAYQDMYNLVKRFRRNIVESMQNPFCLKKREQIIITQNHPDREITKLLSTLQESKKDNTKSIILEGNLFYGPESTEIKSVEYKNREVFLNTIYLGSTKKYKIYVENAGKVERVEFGEKNFEIRKTDPTVEYPGIWVCKDWKLNEYITHSGDKWIVHSEDGKVLGTHDSEEKAKDQLQAIHISQHKEDMTENNIEESSEVTVRTAPTAEEALSYVIAYAKKFNYDWKDFSVREIKPSAAIVDFSTENGKNDMGVWWTHPGDFGYNEATLFPQREDGARMYGEW